MRYKPYSSFADVFENKSKPVEKYLRAALLAGLAVSLSMAVMLQFGWVHAKQPKPVVTIQTAPVPTSPVSYRVVVSDK